MPPRAVKGAQKSSAQAMLAAKGGTPEGLSSFLGGFVAGGGVSDPSSPITSAARQEQEGAIAMNLRLLSKSSDITKLKSLAELTSRVALAREDSLSQFVPSIAEAVIRHAHHANPQVRAGVFALLKALMSRGKDVKVSLVSDLPALAPEWMMGMNDMEPPVQQEAREAFEAAFSQEKRPAMLLKYKDDILRVLFDHVTDIALSGKALTDDQLDSRANTLFSALRAMGYMTKQVSASQTAILGFILENPVFMKVLPTRTPEKNYIAEKTPLVRSAALSLLRDVASVCPCTSRLHQFIAQAVHGSILDPSAVIAARVWELLLIWCRTNVTDVISNLPKGFLDDVVDSFMECTKAELAEVIFPCLFPLLTQLSKDARLPDVLDEFCGALVEKLRLLGETPNVSAHEMQVIFQALMECWELHCVRKKGTDAASDCEELFTVILTNLSTLVLAAPKRRRYLDGVVRILCKSLLKTSVRNELAFKHCIAILFGKPDAPFRPLPEDAEASLRDSFHVLWATTVGALYSTAVQEGTYTRQLPLFEGYVTSLIAACAASEDTGSLVAVFTSAAPAFQPSKPMMHSIIDYLLRLIPALGDVSDVSTNDCAANCKALLSIALGWDDKECVERLGDVARGKAMAGVQEAVRERLLKDPAKAFDLLVLSCETNALEDVAHCARLLTESQTALTEECHDALLRAITAGLADTLHLVKGDDATMEQEKRDAAAARAEETSSSTTSNSNSSISDSDDSDKEGSSVSSDEKDDDDGSDSSSSSGAPSSAENGTKKQEETAAAVDLATLENKGPEVMARVMFWADALVRGGALATLLGLTGEVFENTLAIYFYRIVAAVAPPLLPEYYVSIKALRVALLRQTDDEADEDGEDDEASASLDFAIALEGKVHSLRSRDFDAVVAQVEELLDSHAVSAQERDLFASGLLSAVLEGAVPLCCQAFHQFQQVAPFASPHLLRRFVDTLCVTEKISVRPRQCATVTAAASNGATDELLSLFDGYLSLADMNVTLLSVARTAQVLRLMDACDALLPSSALHVGENPPTPLTPASTARQSAHALLFMLKAAAAREAFSDGTRAMLFERLLPQALQRVDSKRAACELVSRVVDEEEDGAYLLVTLAAVLRDVARGLEVGPRGSEQPPEVVHFLLCGRRIASAVTKTAVDALFTSDGAKGIRKAEAALHATFYTLMDQTANAVRDNLLGQLPKMQEALFTEACMMLPTWDITTAKQSLIVHRHLSTMPVVADSTVKRLVEYAQKQNPLDCLELLAELSMTRILDLSVYGEVVRVIVHSLCRCYTLRHLPSNGRLTQAPADRPTPALSFSHLRRIATAAVVARRGVIVHSRTDDVLRSTVNLVVFDIVCEAVSRLRSTKEEEVPRLAKLIAFTSDFMGELLRSDVAVLRASEASVLKIASVLTFVYLWVSVTPIAKLEAIGMDTVAAVVGCVAQLSNLTLVRSGTPLREAMGAILEKTSLKPLRDEFSTADVLKEAKLRRQNTLISKTHKQKLLLFPYVLAWAVALTSTSQPDETNSSNTGTGVTVSTKRSLKERRAEVYAVLDLLLSLLFTSYVSTQHGNKAGRIEDTFVGSAIGAGGGNGDANPFAGTLGFEVVALTRTNSPEPMAQLARGATSVFALLLQGPTLTFVRSWIETLERKLQGLLHEFVEVYISPTLTLENLYMVLSHSPDGEPTFNTSDEMSVHVSVAQRRIELAYETDDAKVGVSINFPPAFPLRTPTVDYGRGRDCGVSDEKWRSWMLKMTAKLFGGSVNLWECVELFQHNLDAHLGGQEPCPICFAVVNSINHKLPDMQCSVCRNSFFHSSCLYSWWANSGQNVCPLCRAPWISD